MVSFGLFSRYSTSSSAAVSLPEQTPGERVCNESRFRYWKVALAFPYVVLG